MSVNVPFTNSILDITVTGNTQVYVPAFPGAYFYSAYPANANGWFIPIYTSISHFTHNGFLPLFNDVDKQVTVLPGYTLEMYSDISYIPVSPAYTIDNSAGTDIKVSVIPTINTGSSCKLYYTPASTGIKSELTYRPNPVLISNGNYSYVSYGSSDYVLFSFTSGTGAIINNVRDVSAELLVVAGGGAGGYSAFAEGSGGAGAGGVAIGKLHISKNVTYICTVGNGAQPNNTQAVFNGGDSTITNQSETLTVKGGGGGASGFDGNTNGGQNGGSGGGSTAAWAKQSLIGTKQNGTNNLPGSPVSFFGSNGGPSTGSWGSNVAGGGGGGGAGGVGVTGSPGNGGPGTQWAINGAYYGGGGAGGAGTAHNHLATGGIGGGGAGGVDGTANTGGGGGGQRSGVYGRGKGGSGIIIIAIKMSDIY